MLKDIAFNIITLFLYRAGLVSGNGRFCVLFRVSIYSMTFLKNISDLHSPEGDHGPTFPMGNLYQEVGTVVLHTLEHTI